MYFAIEYGRQCDCSHKRAIASTMMKESIKSLAASCIDPSEEWSTEHHALLIWKYFRQEGFLAELEEDLASGDAAKIKAAVSQRNAARDAWMEFYKESGTAHASNQAKKMAAEKICAVPKKLAIKLADKYE